MGGCVWGGMESMVGGCVWGVLEGIFGDVYCVGWPVAPAVMVGDIAIQYLTIYMYSNGGKHYCNVQCTVLTIYMYSNDGRLAQLSLALSHVTGDCKLQCSEVQ